MAFEDQANMILVAGMLDEVKQFRDAEKTPGSLRALLDDRYFDHVPLDRIIVHLAQEADEWINKNELRFVLSELGYTIEIVPEITPNGSSTNTPVEQVKLS